jgi:hypothetical protein
VRVGSDFVEVQDARGVTAIPFDALLIIREVR